MAVLKILVKCLVWTILSIPFFIILWIPYFLDKQNILTLSSGFKAVVSRVSDQACLSTGLTKSLPSCLYAENQFFLVLLGVSFAVVFSMVIGRPYWQKSKPIKRLVDNIVFLCLIIPVLYYLYLYLPTTWRADNPAEFLFLAGAVFGHVICIGILNQIFLFLFDSNLDKTGT